MNDKGRDRKCKVIWALKARGVGVEVGWGDMIPFQ